MTRGTHKSRAALLEYLSVTPNSLHDAIRLYSCYARAGFGRLASPGEFRTVGQYLAGSDLVSVKVGGVNFFVRPGTEDLGYVLPSHKPVKFGDDWFTPIRGATFIDVGASIGSFSVRAAIAGMNVIAIEPHPGTYEILNLNVGANRLTNIVTKNIAIGTRIGQVELWMPERGTGRASLFRPSGPHDQRTEADRALVPMLNLDQLTTKLPRVDVLMIDVEGAELDVLRGSSETLRKTDRLILEIWHGEDERVVRDLLVRAGFHVTQERYQSPETNYLLANRA
jgi:FkbM family methyltransferase